MITDLVGTGADPASNLLTPPSQYLYSEPGNHAMECITCRRDDVFNRVVVNRLSGGEIGLFCEACEAETFGGLLERPAWHQANGCAFCDGDGRFALPALECLVRHDDGSSQLEYPPLEGSVKLCGEHVEELVHPETPVRSPLEV